MGKSMSKTLAVEIAERTLRVVNPANRPMALNDALRRHGFTPLAMAPDDLPGERAALAAWLLERLRA
jgi:hypothetical protein